MSWDKGLALALSLKRVLGDDELRKEFLAHAVIKGQDGLKVLLERRRGELDPALYRELYILLHDRPPPDAPTPGSGIKQGS